eukprot:TRINITY_DN328_c0_g2_i1.p1 TRINITY_DN328_c0_g2~~TRINITY_DN328_c0_g2_i1.p1  ORF type:complete len:507 (+),score=102.42 TRINITY_DN328_c0_g2_i1:727-2247(+)
MGVSDFVKQFDMPEADAAELYDTISLEHQPDADMMDDDISGLHLPGEMTEEEVKRLDLIGRMSPEEFEDMFDLNENYLTFPRFLEIFPKRMPREIVVKAFSLLEKEACGVISIGDLKRFVEAAQRAYKDPSGHRSFVDARRELHTYVDTSSVKKYTQPHNRLSVEGSKKILAMLRGCHPKEIRTHDSGVQYLRDLSNEDFENLFKNCPRNAWEHVSKFDIFEELYQTVEERSLLERDSKTITLDNLLEALRHSHVTDVDVSSEQLEDAFGQIGIDYSMPFDFDYAMKLLKHPTTGQEQLVNVIKSHCERPIQPDKRRPVQLREDGGEKQRKKEVKSVLVTADRLTQVRQKLALFALFGSASTVGFQDYDDSVFRSSSSDKYGQTGCRLNQLRSSPQPSAWCADTSAANPDGTHHIMIKLPNVRSLYAVAMQGRGGGMGEWVTRATVAVSNDGENWESVGSEVVLKCRDGDTVCVAPLMRPRPARCVKLICHQWHKNPSLRWDCLFI